MVQENTELMIQSVFKTTARYQNLQGFIPGQAAIIGVATLYFFQEQAHIQPIIFALEGCDSAEEVSVQ